MSGSFRKPDFTGITGRRNPVGEAQFNNCFDQWFKRMQNPFIAGR